MVIARLVVRGNCRQQRVVELLIRHGQVLVDECRAHRIEAEHRQTPEKSGVYSCWLEVKPFVFSYVVSAVRHGLVPICPDCCHAALKVEAASDEFTYTGFLTAVLAVTGLAHRSRRDGIAEIRCVVAALLSWKCARRATDVRYSRCIITKLRQRWCLGCSYDLPRQSQVVGKRKKNNLSRLIGPPRVAPNWFDTRCGFTCEI